MTTTKQNPGWLAGASKTRAEASSLSNSNRSQGRVATENSRPHPKRMRINFAAINKAAMPHLPSLLARWLPDGHKQGNEWVALNPHRADKHAGSFRTNIRNGKWIDFATGDKGGDVISLAAYIGGISQSQAALNLAQMLGVKHG
jgi:hypothetical protein